MSGANPDPRTNKMKKIKLTQNKIAIVDDEDYPLLSRHSWCLYEKNGLEYAVMSVSGLYNKSNKNKSLYMSQIVKSGKRGFFQIHKNKNTLDNRKKNLEYVSTNFRRHIGRIINKNKTSKYKGVHWYSDHKCWRTQITFNKKRFSKDCSSEKEAAILYNKKAKELFETYAYQNKIQ